MKCLMIFHLAQLARCLVRNPRIVIETHQRQKTGIFRADAALTRKSAAERFAQPFRPFAQALHFSPRISFSQSGEVLA